MPIFYESPQKELESKAEKARANGHWFYNVQTKKWLTPEDFVDEGKMDLKADENCRTTLDSFYPKDPREGIRDRIAYVKKASAELQEFTDSVFEYFNLSAKDEAYLKSRRRNMKVDFKKV